MPYSPKKPCRYPGCPRLTHNTYCDAHAKQVSSHYNRYQRPKRSRPRYHRNMDKLIVCSAFYLSNDGIHKVRA